MNKTIRLYQKDVDLRSNDASVVSLIHDRDEIAALGINAGCQHGTHAVADDVDPPGVDAAVLPQQVGGGHGTHVGAGKALGHGDVQNLLSGELLVEGGDFADGGLGGGGHMALVDDADEIIGADLVELPVAPACDGHGQGRHGKARLPGLGGGLEGGSIGNNADHRIDLIFLYRFLKNRCFSTIVTAGGEIVNRSQFVG